MSLLTDLVSYWKFDETSGSTATDELNNSDGTITSTTNINFNSAGKINYGLRFNASDEHGLRLTTNLYTELVGGSGVTFSSWVKRSAINSDQQIINLEMDTAYFARYYLIFNSDNKLQLAGRSTSDDSFQSGTTATTFISTTEWYHIIGILDFPNDKIKIYVNNNLELDVDVSFGSDTFSNHIGTAPWVGRRFTLTTDYYNLKGMLDEVGCWKRALTASEVSQLYNGSYGLTYPFTGRSIFIGGGL